MISSICGLPGAGKTTVLTWCALRALAGKPLFIGHRPFWTVSLQEFKSYQAVFTTFPLRGCYRFDYEETAGIFKYEHSLILIDEMSHFQDNRDFRTYTPEKKYFWSMMRHTFCDVIWCSQSFRDCDIKIRNMTNQVFLIEKRPRDRSRIIPIKLEQNPKSDDIAIKYTLAPRPYRTTLNRKKLYSEFDSFIYKDLPPVVPIPWIFNDSEK